MFWEQFTKLCAENNTKPNPVAKSLGISSGAVTKWKQDGTTPNTVTLHKIAEYFNVSVDYLLGKTETPTSALDNQLSEIEYALFGEVRDLNDDEKQKIIDFAKFVKSQRGTEK